MTKQKDNPKNLTLQIRCSARDMAQLNKIMISYNLTQSQAIRTSIQLIADQIKSGNPNIDLVTKTLDDAGRIVTNKNAAQVLVEY